MSVLDINDTLRLAVVGGLAGFAVFCASYAIVVWRRRNSASRSPILRIFTAVMLGGIVSAAWIWATNEFALRVGFVDGSDLFVVRSKLDAGNYRLTEKDNLERGDVVAEFIPPANDAQLAILDSRIKEAESRVATLQKRALPLDTNLVQKQAQLRAQVDQASNLVFNLQRNLRELEKEKLLIETAWTREAGELDAEVSKTVGQLEGVTARLKLAEASAWRAADMSRRGLLSNQLSEDRESAFLSLKLLRDQADTVINSTSSRRKDLEQRFRTSAGALDQQIERVRTELTSVETYIESKRDEAGKLEQSITEDKQRAEISLQSEIESAKFQLEAAKADRQRSIAITQLRSPTSGRVIYRHPAPGLVPDNTPILAVSAGSGFRARVLLSAQDVREMEQSQLVRFVLDQPALNRFFSGRFRSAEKVAHSDDTVIAHFDVDLSPEMITMLAASVGRPLTAKLDWRPRVIGQPSFLAALAVSAIGAMGLFMASVRRSSPSPEPVETRPKLGRTPSVLTPMASKQTRMVASREGYSIEHRDLATMATNFHASLRQRSLTHEQVAALQRIIATIGAEALRALADEMIFDAELEKAIRIWTLRHGDQLRSTVIEPVKRYKQDVSDAS